MWPFCCVSNLICIVLNLIKSCEKILFVPNFFGRIPIFPIFWVFGFLFSYF